jgi:DedD protein
VVKEGLKQRLVGAFILMALAVIFLPGFFKERQEHSVNTDTLIPPQPQVETVEFSSPLPSVEVEPAPPPETMFLPDEVLGSATSSAVSSAAHSALARVAEEENGSDVSSATSTESLIPDAWVVQVVSLSSKESAIKLRDELQSEGHKA